MEETIKDVPDEQLAPVETFEKLLEVNLTETEKNEIGEKMGKTIRDINRLEAVKKDVTSNYKKRIDARKQELSELADKLEEGTEERLIKCFWMNDSPREGEKSLIRTDTGEVIDVKPMQLFDKEIVEGGSPDEPETKEAANPEDPASPEEEKPQAENLTLSVEMINQFNAESEAIKVGDEESPNNQ